MVMNKLLKISLIISIIALVILVTAIIINRHYNILVEKYIYGYVTEKYTFDNKDTFIITIWPDPSIIGHPEDKKSSLVMRVIYNKKNIFPDERISIREYVDRPNLEYIAEINHYRVYLLDEDIIIILDKINMTGDYTLNLNKSHDTFEIIKRLCYKPHHLQWFLLFSEYLVINNKDIKDRILEISNSNFTDAEKIGNNNNVLKSATQHADYLIRKYKLH